jgi:hypothetical protein
LRIDAVPLNKALRYYLSSLQWLDASKPPIETHLPGLVANVRSRLSAQDKEAIESESVRAAIEKFEGDAKPSAKDEEATAAASAGKGIGALWRQKKVLLALAAAVILLAAAGIFWAYKSRNSTRPAPQPLSLVNQGGEAPAPSDRNSVGSREAQKPYGDMSMAEKVTFIEERAQAILAQLGDHPDKLDENAVIDIKNWVDDYNQPGRKGSRAQGKTDPRFIFEAARESAPAIIKTFNDRGVPPIIGLYLPVIESEYKNLCTPNDKGQGIFQIQPAMAKADYGLSAEDLCRIEKSAGLAAYRMSKLINEWGKDANNVTLAILCFNRSKSEDVRRDLKRVGVKSQKEQTFWALADGEARLDQEAKDYLGYIPMFFAAAIVGENPRAFGLDMEPLSTYTK